MTVGALAATLALAAVLGTLGPSVASSHREAPLISADPLADNTDTYAFVSPDKPDTVTLVGDWIPLEEPAGGPNFNKFGDDVVYTLNVDNNGDAVDDIVYEFRFRTQVLNPNTFLYNTGPISSLTDPHFNIRQSYSVARVENGIRTIVAAGLTTPPVNIGPRSTPTYTNLAQQAVHGLPGGGKVFAGQRDDPFFVDLGSIFDLAGLRPFNPFHLLPLAAGPGVDAIKNYNTHSIEIQVPTSQLVSFSNPTIGIYASASRQKVRILDENGTTKGRGPWVQVSRLGNPLINEVVIPLGQKDYWNREDPANDSQFASFYTSPEVSRLENALYGTLPQGHAGGALQAIDETGRSDLLSILLTGVHGLNETGSTKSDLLRLNTAITPGINGACPGGTASAVQPDQLAVLNTDLCGYPNGRRLGDDVIDIDLRVFAQGYGSFLNAAFGLPNKTPNNLLGDGVDSNDVSFSGTFPYVAAPHQGYEVP